MTDEAARADEGLGYAINAPYYDLILPEEHWAGLAAAVGGLLKDARSVAEVGAGTGYFTESMLGSLPAGAEIFAIEPARVMRAALVTRLVRRPGAERRVTVLPGDAATADPGTAVDAVVLLNLVMHFAPAERARLWRRWARALTPGGLLIVEAQYPQKAEEVPSSVVPGRTLGRRRYDTVSRAEVIGGDMIRWVNTYRTWEGDRLVQEETAEFDCHVISDELLAAELSAAGLSPVPDAPESLRVWRR
ncbi:class I SAM-dependent methyltransferase [Actinomadura madurae]|uniref:class I SAM-dependent methyltransferase n=2 Tax=Actinomadura madurae TaxID=1993 RepID=UPI002025D997|nr:class I SAM-dependent methyltransferase [Actinomadura madurae]MCQ0003567.1 class I SAM-dependent methyltransferase [Actinomadura madurae]URN01085.1 class I SAM-dependent methyltransferase [Actinomadura madurae]URN03222.1 class I SAM-dependent methyltransferase [Actinomadura madurae]